MSLKFIESVWPWISIQEIFSISCGDTKEFEKIQNHL